MRIAWTGPVGDGGGVPGMGKLMLQELLRQGVEVDVYLPLVGAEAPSLEPSPRLRVIEQRSGWQWRRWYSRTLAGAQFTSLAARSLANIQLSIRLLKEHRRRRYDAVFQLSTSELFVLGRLRRLAPPIVVHPCSHAAGELRWHRAEEAYAMRSERRSIHRLMRTLLEFRSWVQPRELARADLVIGPSRRFVELLHDDYGVPPEKLFVLRHPVDLGRFSPDGSHPRTAGPRTLLFVSRISARKGVPEIVELSHRLADLAGSVRLLIVGGPTMWSDYTAHLVDLNPTVAEYAGGVPNEELLTLLQSATMVLVPSRYEPGSIVTGEALACGVPVVLSDEVGPAEVVEGPHVRVHRAGDVASLEAAVRSLLDAVNRDEAAIRTAARRNAEQQFAPQVVVSQLRDAIRSHNRPAPARARTAPIPASATVCSCTRDLPEEPPVALASIDGSSYPVSQVVVSDDRYEPDVHGPSPAV